MIEKGEYFGVLLGGGMISTISGHRALGAELLGTASASPQSARGESVTPSGVRTEKIAASQANSPLYDQRANLTDQTVAARAQTAETVLRSGLLEAEAASAPLAAAHMKELAASRAPATPRSVEAGQEADSKNELRGNTRRALAAYAGPAPKGPAAGELFDLAV